MSPRGHSLGFQARQEESGAWPASLPSPLTAQARPSATTRPLSPGASLHHEGPQWGTRQPHAAEHLPSRDIGCPKPKQTLRDVVPGASRTKGTTLAKSNQLLVCPSPDLSPAAAVFRTLYQMPGNGVTVAWPLPSKARPGASSGCPAPSPARGEAKALLTAAVRRARGAARAVSPGAQTPAETRCDVASCTRSPANGRGFINM